MVLVRKVDDKVKQSIVHDMKEFGYDIMDFQNQLSKLSNLWSVIRFYLIIDTYVFIYTLISLVQGLRIQKENPDVEYVKTCNVIFQRVVIDEYLWLAKRLFNFSMW